MAYVFIVDPYSSGNQLAPAFFKDGALPIYVRSNLALGARSLKGIHPSDFISDLPAEIQQRLLSGDKTVIEQAIQDAMKHLREVFEKDVSFYIIPGGEAGVTLAEKLSAKFDLPTYDPRAIKSHRSKPHMHWEVRKAGIEIIPMTIAHNAEEALHWIRHGLGGIEKAGGVVVKTGTSASGTQVIPCYSEAEVITAVNSILATRSNFGLENKSVMIQPFVKGREFAVNSVSFLEANVLHTVITDVWEYFKPAPPAYGYEVLLSPDEIPPGLLDKHHGVKVALKWRKGPGHGEYFVTPEGNIFLGEIAARMYGAGNTDISGASTLYGQVRGTVDSLLHPDEIISRSFKPYTLTHRAAVVNINAPFSEVPLFANRQIHSVLEKELGPDLYKAIYFAEDGERLNESTNLIDTVAQIEIRVPNEPGSKEKLNRLIERVNELQNAFWRLNP